MTLNDVDAVYDIEKSAYPFPWAKSIFEQAIASTKHTVVLESENKICGYGVVSYVVGEAELLNICVAPFAQGSGFGQQLLAHLINHAAQFGNQDMYLEVRVSNKSAIHLYEKAGFNEVGVRSNYYPTESGREDAILMALSL